MKMAIKTIFTNSVELLKSFKYQLPEFHNDADTTDNEQNN